MGEEKIIRELFSRKRLKDLYQIKKVNDEHFIGICRICDYIVTGRSEKEAEYKLALHIGSHYANRKIILN